MRGTYRPRIPTYFEQHLPWIRNLSHEQLCNIRDNLGDLSNPESSFTRKKEEIKKESKNGVLSVEYKGPKTITTTEQAAELCDIDLNQWEAKDGISFRNWEVTTSEGNTYTNYYFRVDFKRKKKDLEQIRAALLADIPSAPVSKPVQRKKRASQHPYVVEFAIMDLHLGKIPYTKEVEWSLEDSRKVYFAAIFDTLEQLDTSKIDHFILPTGNDFFNIDTPFNATTKGTPQMAGIHWTDLFSFGHQLVSSAITELVKIAPVFVYMVPGNHDQNSVFTMGEVLAARFEGNKYVTINNTPIKRKYHRFGLNLIGFSHGNNIKAKDAFSAMSTDQPVEFGQTKFRYFHTGHLHKNSKRWNVDTQIKDEYNGVEIEVCPSLSPTDVWHYQNLYTGNIRRSKAFVYHRDKGMVKEFNYTLQ